jgi:hypothetical protein
MPIYKDDQYDPAIYGILKTHSLCLAKGYVYLCANKNDRNFSLVFYSIIPADMPHWQAVNFINNKNPTIGEFIELNTEIWPQIARHFSRVRAERHSIICLRDGAPHLAPRFRRVESSAELIKLISEGFSSDKANYIYDLAWASCRFIMSTPYYRYGVRPTPADIPGYRALVAWMRQYAPVGLASHWL